MITLNTNALCTRANVKDFLQITAAGNDIDDFINQTINRISTMFESFCGRIFASDTYTEYHDGGGSWLFPKNTPITSITSINQDSAWLWTDDDITSTEYRTADNNSVYYDGIFTKGIQSVKLVYVGGYVALPEDLIQITIIESARIVKHRVDFDVLNVTRDDGSVQYRPDFLPLTLKTLGSYKVQYIL